MKKIDTSMAISESTKEGISQLKKLGISIGEDEWTIVQPYSDGNAIITSVVEEEGNRVVKQLINDCVVVLPAIEGTLDVFN